MSAALDLSELQKLVPMSAAARLAGMQIDVFRRRMYRLNYFADGKLLVPRGEGQKKRRFWVDVAVLKWVVENAPAERDNDLDAVRWDVAQIKKELEHEKRKRIALHAQVRRLLRRTRDDARRRETTPGSA